MAPVELYFRPPGTTGAADVLFERDTFRNNGSGSEVANEARETIYGAYFQDRWKPRANISVKAGFRVDSNRIYTKDREKVLGPALPPGFPTVTSDQEFNQTTFAPNAGIALDLGHLGIVRGTAGRYYEWLDLGGGDGTSHPPYVVATDVARSSPRALAPILNQTLPGAFPLGVNYGLDNKKCEVFARQCLTARRLVERGVRFIQIFAGKNAGGDFDELSGNLVWRFEQERLLSMLLEPSMQAAHCEFPSATNGYHRQLC